MHKARTKAEQLAEGLDRVLASLEQIVPDHKTRAEQVLLQRRQHIGALELGAGQVPLEVLIGIRLSSKDAVEDCGARELNTPHPRINRQGRAEYCLLLIGDVLGHLGVAVQGVR